MRKEKIRSILVDMAMKDSKNYYEIINTNTIVICFKNNIELRYTYGKKDLIVNIINDETTKYSQSHGFNIKAIRKLEINEYNNLVIEGKDFLSIIKI